MTIKKNRKPQKYYNANKKDSSKSLQEEKKTLFLKL